MGSGIWDPGYGIRDMGLGRTVIRPRECRGRAWTKIKQRECRGRGWTEIKPRVSGWIIKDYKNYRRLYRCEEQHPTSHGFRVLRFRLSHFRISRFRVSRFRLTRFRVSCFRLTRFRVSPSEEKRHVISTIILPCMYIFPSRAPYCTVQSMLLPNHTCSAMGKANDFALVS